MGKIEINFSGLEELKKDLEKRQKKLKEHENEVVPLTELFDFDFMQRYTEYSDFNEMLDSGDFEIENQEEADKLFDSQEWEDYIIDTTQFASWDEMCQTAANERISKILELD